MTITIPRAAWMLTDPDTGNTVADLAGIGIKAFVRCPECGELSSLRKHSVAPNGTVSPSYVCPFPPCTFHEWVRLEGWEVG